MSLKLMSFGQVSPEQCIRQTTLEQIAREQIVRGPTPLEQMQLCQTLF
jgi:hypothetical protein